MSRETHSLQNITPGYQVQVKYPLHDSEQTARKGREDAEHESTCTYVQSRQIGSNFWSNRYQSIIIESVKRLKMARVRHKTARGEQRGINGHSKPADRPKNYAILITSLNRILRRCHSRIEPWRPHAQCTVTVSQFYIEIISQITASTGWRRSCVSPLVRFFFLSLGLRPNSLLTCLLFYGTLGNGFFSYTTRWFVCLFVWTLLNNYVVINYRNLVRSPAVVSFSCCEFDCMPWLRVVG